ncbi:MAG: tRNA lysidine(34) synthetase TilS [Bdellovibrionales bacterium RBG_16_40_8]|nr:MAG: tRNA lysidine(34) synthetase TilS [Bdellovibrionales bacterium RBG_16_40_8]
MDSLQLKLLPVEHKVLRDLRKVGGEGHHILVAVSGGRDSMVLLTLLKRLQPLIKSPLYVGHIHHGRGDRVQTIFRNRARRFVKKSSSLLNLPFYTNKTLPRAILRSEAELRNFRYKELQKILTKISRKSAATPYLALAHHQDDLLETQIIRLIRGTGLYGLKAMSVLSEEKLRPLLKCTGEEIQDLANKLNVRWLDDPSNENRDTLRNWLRHKWLLDLEKKIPGSKTSLARSLSNISSNDKKSTINVLPIHKQSLSRPEFLFLSRDEKCSIVARYLVCLKISHYTQGQIEEIVRRLDNRRGEFRFRLLNHEWRVNAERIQALKV